MKLCHRVINPPWLWMKIYRFLSFLTYNAWVVETREAKAWVCWKNSNMPSLTICTNFLPLKFFLSAFVSVLVFSSFRNNFLTNTIKPENFAVASFPRFLSSNSQCSINRWKETRRVAISRFWFQFWWPQTFMSSLDIVLKRHHQINGSFHPTYDYSVYKNRIMGHWETETPLKLNAKMSFT